jgi:hypothetical protein
MFISNVVESACGGMLQVYFCLSFMWYRDLAVMVCCVCYTLGQVWSGVVKGWEFTVTGSWEKWEKWEETESGMVPLRKIDFLQGLKSHNCFSHCSFVTCLAEECRFMR